MNKAQLAAEVAKKTKLPKAQCERAINEMLDCMKGALRKGQRVQLIGFGSFDVRQRAARRGRNPQTGAEMKIPARKTVRFRAGKALKGAL